ncbi:MAG: ArnT family glycosyltransferase, partial [Betaproteobacteria bacterium]
RIFSDRVMIETRTVRTIPIAAALILFLLWITPGLLDRDLWKADEPYSFGLVEHIVKTGDWIVPTLAGEPFMEKPPIFYLTAAGFVRLLSPWLEPHNAARLASAFFMLLTVVFTGLAAKELMGKDSAGTTMFLLIGSAGLQVTTQKLITDIALIAGLSAALYGLALCRRRPVPGGFWLGTGAGIGFMSKGLLAPGLVGLTALALPLFFSGWRRKTYAVSLFTAFIAALPWLVIWPAALYHRSPQLFIEWFWNQNLGRFLGYAHVGRKFSHAFYLIHLPWFALPSLPFALRAAWRCRGTWNDSVRVHVPLTAFLVMFFVLSVSSSIRNIYALPMLLPLSLLAAAGVDSLPGKARTILNRATLGLFGFLAAAVWLGWVVNITGTPSFFANYLHRLQPDYMPAVNGSLFVIACLYTLIWFIVVMRSSAYEHSYIVNWSAGMVLIWGLVMTLWLPWIDAGSGYRAMFTSLRDKIPSQCRSVMMQGLGESERALLVYYTGVLPRAAAGNGHGNCDMLLVQSSGKSKAPSPGPGWQIVWEWQRPVRNDGHPKEIFTLFKRNGGEDPRK